MTNLSAIIAPTNVVTETGTQTLSNKTLVAPALGTPASGNLSNCTNLPAGSAATPTVLGTVYGKQTASGASPYLTAYGYEAGPSSTGVNNVLIGYQAGYNQVAGEENTFVGFQAGLANVSSYYLTAVGYHALKANTTGLRNTALGYALFTNTTGGENVALGHQAMGLNTSGTDNVAVGMTSLYDNTTGINNTACGRDALRYNTTGNYCTALGYRALYSNTSNNNNTGIGNQSLSTATGSSNTGCGDNSGYQLTSGNYNCFFGHYAYGSAATNSHEIVIGYNTVGKGGSTGFINPASGGVYQGNNSSSWSTTSDQRLKKNIADNNDGLDKITSIRVRNFEYRVEDEITELPTHAAIKKSGVQLGVIAQELQAVLPECVKTESTGVMSVDADNLTWYLINAVKELSARVKQLEGN